MSLLLLTGVPGVGKSTVIRRVADALAEQSIGGFLTGELRAGAERPQRRRAAGKQRVGFGLETFDGEKAILAHVELADRPGCPRVSRYGVDLEALERIVEETLRPELNVDLFLVDEIGKMECFSERFIAAMEAVVDGTAPVVATVALRGSGFIGAIKRRPGAELWEVTRSNREEMPARVLAWFAEKQRAGGRS
jgi:nucleoside-triphosphatase